MRIETKRLILRDYVFQDWQEVHAYAANPMVTKFMIWGPNSEEQTKEFIERTIARQGVMPREDYEFAVIEKDSDQLIGGISLHLEERNGELGYCLHPNYWNKGFATEAANTILELGFNRLELHRICATCRPQNERSIRLLKRLGMKQEGHLREHIYYEGTYYDSYLFSILSHEYASLD